MDDHYGYGEICTWHGPLTFASMDLEERPFCPHCGLRLHTMPSSAMFWQQVASTDRNMPGYEAMMRWSEGKCFSDYDTMQNAYRQAMTGHV